MQKYIHYGSKAFDISQFEPIRNHPVFRMKPDGGLWASPVESDAWKVHILENELDDTYNLESHFTFTLINTANVVVLDDASKLDSLPRANSSPAHDSAITVELDFEEILSRGADAILFLISADDRLYSRLFGWDVDSLLVMNPKVITP